jgi:hypothetical protein
MNTPLTVLRNQFERALAAFCALTNTDPDEVWGALVKAPSEPDWCSLMGQTGDLLWKTFKRLHEAETAEVELAH